MRWPRGLMSAIFAGVEARAGPLGEAGLAERLLQDLRAENTRQIGNVSGRDACEVHYCRRNAPRLEGGLSRAPWAYQCVPSWWWRRRWRWRRRSRRRRVGRRSRCRRWIWASSWWGWMVTPGLRGAFEDLCSSRTGPSASTALNTRHERKCVIKNAYCLASTCLLLPPVPPTRATKERETVERLSHGCSNDVTGSQEHCERADYWSAYG